MLSHLFGTPALAGGLTLAVSARAAAARAIPSTQAALGQLGPGRLGGGTCAMARRLGAARRLDGECKVTAQCTFSRSSCVGSDIDRGAISYITMGESTYRLPCSTRRRLFHGGHMTQADGGFMGSGFVCSTPPNKKRENVHDSVRHRLS